MARLPKDDSRRQLLPNQFYDPPPPQPQRPAGQFSELTLRQALNEAKPQQKLWRLLPGLVAGISPFVAREIVYRATGKAGTTVEQVERLLPIVEATHELFD